MKLRLIYGRAGRGKSTYCIEEMANKINEKDIKKILIVPEQLSFESEKKVIERIGGVGLNNVHVLSFKRMAYWVFKDCGGIAKKHIDKCGKSMIIYSILEEIEEELRVFSKSAAYSGFVDSLLTMISEFKRYNITPEGLSEIKIKVGENTLLYNKIHDLQNIFKTFGEKLGEEYLDGEDDLSLMEKKFSQCNIFDNSYIWIDEFSGFTPQQYNIIEELLGRAREVNVTLNMGITDRKRGLEDVLEPLISTENKLIKICEREGISIDEPVDIHKRGKSRFNSKELLFLEENYFKYPFSTYNEEVKDISIFKGLNPYGEVENLAGEIIKIVREKGGRYRDIAVVSRALDSYDNIIESIFKENDIPFFLDQKKEASSNPIVVTIIAAMEIYNRGWNYQSVFRFLKSGIIPWDNESIDILENYIIMSGIKGKGQWNNHGKWNEKLLANLQLKKKYCEYYGFVEEEISDEEIISMIDKGVLQEKNVVKLELSKEDIDVLGDIPLEAGEKELVFTEFMDKVFKMNALRKDLIKRVTPFHDAIKGNRTCEDMAAQLFKFIENLEMYEIIQRNIEEFNESGRQELADEYGHIWNVIVDVLDQMVNCFKDVRMKVDKFSEILNMGLQQHKMGFIPNTADQVLVSSIERVKSHDIKYLFVLGVNDGVFPSADFQEGILSDLDRMALNREGVELAKDTKSKTFQEQYLIYTTLSIPREYLRLSYPVANAEGKTLRSSIIIARLKSLFPRIKEESNLLTKKMDEIISSRRSAFNNLVISLRKGEDSGEIHELWREVYHWFLKNNGYSDRIENLINYFDYENTVEKISEEGVKNLYSRDNLFSVSKLEKYNECPFSYFIRYGLRAKERKTFELSAPDLGSFMHEIIDKFSNEVKDGNKQWSELDDQWCRERIDSLIEIGMDEPVGRIFKTTPKYKYFGNRIKRVLNKSIWAVVEHMKRSEFMPYGYEMEFGGKEYSPIEILLEDGTKVKLVGKIDRVDKLVMNSEEYFRIIDYKSGNKTLKLSKVYYGLQLQLVTYLDAILNSEERKDIMPVMPAGIFYFKIDDPMIKAPARMSMEDLGKEILKNMKMKGLVLKDTEIITRMDNEIEGMSLIIPAKLKKDGTLAKGGNLATLEEFRILREHVRVKLKETCTRILQGEIDIHPFKTSTGDTPCTYCDFAHICAFDPLLKNNNYKVINDIKDNAVWEMLNKDENIEKEES